MAGLITRESSGVTPQRIVGVVVRRRFHMIQVVTEGEDAVVAADRRIGERFLPVPGLNQGGLGQIRRQYFIPANHVLAMACQNRQQTAIEIGVQLRGSLKPCARIKAWIAGLAFHCASSISSPPM